MKKFSEIMNNWYAFFDNMKIGEYVEIAIAAKRDPKLFIDMCKMYIDEHPDFEFSNDYAYFKRMLPFELTEKIINNQ